MKTVTVLYFAALRELTGTRTETVELPDSVHSVEQFGVYLANQRPELKALLSSVRIAQNEAFAEGQALIDDGDVLALIPPVQGG